MHNRGKCDRANAALSPLDSGLLETDPRHTGEEPGGAPNLLASLGACTRLLVTTLSLLLQPILDGKHNAATAAHCENSKKNIQTYACSGETNNTARLTAHDKSQGSLACPEGRDVQVVLPAAGPLPQPFFSETLRVPTLLGSAGASPTAPAALPHGVRTSNPAT